MFRRAFRFGRVRSAPFFVSLSLCFLVGKPYINNYKHSLHFSESL